MKMTVLEDVLQEELERLTRIKQKTNEEIEKLPKGYLSKKKIRGYACYYLQHREGDKIVGFYVKEKDIPVYAAEIERRRALQRSLKEINAELKKIQRVVK